MPSDKAFIEIVGLGDLLKKLSPESAEKVGRDAVKTLRQVSIYIRDDAKRFCPVETGRLRASLTASEPYDNAGIIVSDIGTDVDYAQFVEFGTGRRGGQGQTEGNAITEMARRFMSFIGYSYGAGKIRPNSEGMAARPFLFPALELWLPRIPELFMKAVVNVLTGGEKKAE